MAFPQLVSADWHAVGVADFNGDGQNDILWQKYETGGLIVWYMNGTTQLSVVSLPNVTPTTYHVVGTGDFNGDAKPDIVLQDTVDFSSRVWFMNGVAPINNVPITPAVAPGWNIAATADIDGDTQTDLVWHKPSTGEVFVWLMNGSAQRSGTFTVPSSATTDFSIVSVTDLNGDAHPDILWEAQTGTYAGKLFAWYMNGTVQTSTAFIPPTVAPPTWRVVGPK